MESANEHNSVKLWLSHHELTRTISSDKFVTIDLQQSLETNKKDQR